MIKVAARREVLLDRHSPEPSFPGWCSASCRTGNTDRFILQQRWGGRRILNPATTGRRENVLVFFTGSMQVERMQRIIKIL
jgi:hypothetical protein